MNNNQIRNKKKFVGITFWILVCLGLAISSCSGNVEKGSEAQATEEPENIVVLPQEIIHASDLGLGSGSISGRIQESQVSWEKQSMDQYVVAMVDAVPFLTVQADLSALQIFSASPVDKNGSFSIDLPQQAVRSQAVQVMMLVVEKNSCLIPGNQFYDCWDAELASIAFPDAAQNRVTDGKVLVWAADDMQSFPQDMGPDGKFFTEDDDLLPLEPGYTMVDLGTKPFAFDHQSDGKMSLFSDYDPAVRDLSTLTYTEAFERIFADMRAGYAFNGVEGKEPDWDAVYELIYPQVQAAEESGDVNDWIGALNAYTQQFSDSHVSISGDVVDKWVNEKYSHGYIYYFNQLSNGDLIYSEGTTSNIEAERFKYYHMGHKLVEIYETPVNEKITEVTPIFGSFSNPDMFYRALVRDIPHIYSEKGYKFGLEDFLGRVDIDQYKLADAYTITAEEDYIRPYDPGISVDSQVTDTGIGLITIHSDGHDAQTTRDLFDKALRNLSDLNLDTIIIDMRDSDEYRFMNYAGYLSNAPIKLGQMAWKQLGENEGKERTQEFISMPQENPYLFTKIAVFTGERCKDACEADVYALSLLPQTTVYGETSSFGSFAITNPIPYTLPGQITFNYSTGSFNDENGNLLLEGKGVPVDVQIEERISTYLHDYDWQLPYLVDLLAFENELNITPEIIPQPLELTEEEFDRIIEEIDQRDIEYLSIDVYPSLYQPIYYTYRVFIQDPGKLIISKKWCSDIPDLSLYKGEELKVEVIVDGKVINEEYFHPRVIDKFTYKCWVNIAVLDNWVPGKHTVKINTEIAGQFFNDGAHWYDQGNYTEEYTVVVKESE